MTLNPQKVFFFMADPNQSSQKGLSLAQMILLLSPRMSSSGQGKGTSMFVFLMPVMSSPEAEHYLALGLRLPGHPSTAGKSL